MRGLLLAGVLVSGAAVEAAPPQRSVARLSCGGARLTAETFWSIAPDAPQFWLGQRIEWSRTGTPGAVALVLEGQPGRHARSVPDAVVVSWACVRSSRGVNYVVLGHGCASEDVRHCGGEREWFRLFDEHGQRVDTGLARQDKGYARLHARLGLTEVMARGVQMASLLPD